MEMRVAITFSRYGLSGELLCLSGGAYYLKNNFTLTEGEALQVRDELLRRYPLDNSQFDRMLIERGFTMTKPAMPTPAPLSLEVGKWYLRRDGETVQIVRFVKDWDFSPFKYFDAAGYTYAVTGANTAFESPQPRDLIAETTAPVQEKGATNAGERPLAIGDTVRLKSGGPVMTIIRADVQSWVCAYAEDGKIVHKTFPPVALVRAKP